jgi:hypothetical protein
MPVVEVLRDSLPEILVRDGNEAANVIRIICHDSTMNLKDIHVLRSGKTI